jgi:hypothetical protein
VLEGLKTNNISKLYIFSDGPKNDNDNKDVKEVRSLIANVDWCETEIHISPENKGLASSIIDGVNYILNDNQRIVVLEDDCVPSKGFISFMAKCLNRYEDYSRIMSISGYSPPIRIPENYKFDIYFSYRFCSSSWGTWKRAWKFFKKEYNLKQKINKSKNFKRRVFLAGRDLIPMLEKQSKYEGDSWAVFWALNIIENNGLCINPTKPRIKNIGFDDSGVHSKSTNKFDVNLYEDDSENLKLPDKISVNNKIVKRYRSFYVPSMRKEFKLKSVRIVKFLRIYKLLKEVKSKISGG